MDEIALTIGNFDGVHLGHQALLKKLKERGKKTAVVTFSNHPSTILKQKPVKLISTLSHKLHLLQNIDFLIVKEFTTELSQLSAEDFLLQVQKEIPFSKLILGQPSRLGHKREAGHQEIDHLALKLGFAFEPISLLDEDGQICSSTRIRNLIALGELKQVETLLGRPYSIFSQVQLGEGKGRLLGFRTLNVAVNSLSLPPLGVYTASIKHKNRFYKGIANLGFAPTLKTLEEPLLEVHLLDCEEILIEEEIEVVFHHFLRQEMKFSSPEALKNQIKLDIQLATSKFI